MIARFEGVEGGLSKKGTAYADVYFKEVDKNGDVALKQTNYRTFDVETIALCKVLNVGDMISIDLEIKEALVRSISRIDMED